MTTKGNSDNKDSKGFNDQAFFEAIGNADTMESSVSKSNENGDTPANFFQKAIESGRQELTAKKTESKNTGDDDEVVPKKRYEDSSREAQRLKVENDLLKSKLEQVEPYLPVVGMIKEDPGVLKAVRSYVDGGGQTPKSIKEELGLPDNFIVDMEDVTANPDSDSAKVFNRMVDKIVEQRMTVAQQEFDKKNAQQEQERRLETEKEALKQKYKLTDDDIQDLRDWANKQPFNLEMIFKLKNLETRDRKIIQSLENDRLTQRSRIAGTPMTLGTVGSQKTTDDGVSDDEIIFNKIRSTVNSGNIFARK